MENLFYVPKNDFTAKDFVEIGGQEAQHISRVLRHTIGDEIWVADGNGSVFNCTISEVSKKLVRASINKSEFRQEPEIKKVLAFGVIKKRDRLEFAVEKAVELGAWEICLFKGDHSERSRINEERIQNIVISAFKQSKRFWMPEVVYLDSIEEVFNMFSTYTSIMAHVEADQRKKPQYLTAPSNLLMIGPEGGFSDREVQLAKKKGVELISLGPNRLRAETAAATILSFYLFSE